MNAIFKLDEIIYKVKKHGRYEGLIFLIALEIPL